MSELPTRTLMLLKLVLCMYADIGRITEQFTEPNPQNKGKRIKTRKEEVCEKDGAACCSSL